MDRNPTIYNAIANFAELNIRQDAIYQLSRLYQQNREAIRLNHVGIIWLLATLKHEGFVEEKEIRFACINRLKKKGGGFYNISPYEINIQNSAPRLQIDFKPSAIERIIIGPQPNPEKLKIIIQILLDSKSLKNIPIIASNIPFVPRRKA